MPPAKAYHVSDPHDDEGRSVIVFAHTPNRARQIGMGQLDYCDYVDLRARRAPEFDGCFGEEALMREQLRMGWWFGCNAFHCRGEIRDNGEWDEGRSDSGHVIRDGEIFCSAACCLTELRRRRQDRKDRWDAIARAVVAWPGAEVLDLFRNVAGEWIVTIREPGKEHPVTTALP